MKDLIEKIKRTYTRRKKTEKVSRQANPHSYVGILLPIPENSGMLRRVNMEKPPAAEGREDGQVKALQEWMKGAKDYGKQFLNALRERKILNFSGLDDYLDSGSIFQDVYFLSADQGHHKASVLKPVRPRSVSGNIDQELKHLPKLRLIFVFSTRIWDALYKKYQPVLVGHHTAPASVKITKVHGLPFEMEYDDRKILLIPLVQMDQKVFNNLLRNSYFDYLGEGLDEAAKYL